MPKSRVDWYENDVLLAVDQATDDLVTRLAFWIEGETKPNMNVDTGFNRNATYTIPAGGKPESMGSASGEYQDKEGHAVERRRVESVPEVPPHTAAVHQAAEYAIYQETIKPSLYPALRKAQKMAPSVIQEVGRKRL